MLELRLSQNSCGDEEPQFKSFVEHNCPEVRVSEKYFCSDIAGLYDEDGERIGENTPKFIDYWVIYCKEVIL